MKMGVRVFGSKETREALKRRARQAGLAANELTFQSSNRVAQYMRDSILQGPKTGRIYRLNNPTRVHQASAPGEAPANDLGGLHDSIYVKYRRLNQYAYSADIGASAPYADQLEWGYPPNNVLPRPFLRPAVDRVEAEMDGIIADIWMRYMR